MNEATASDVQFRVLKFGGTSVSTASRWATIAKLAQSVITNGEQCVVVVSALSKITDQLKALSELNQHDAKSQALLNGIRLRHEELAAEVGLKPDLVSFHPSLQHLENLMLDTRRASLHFSWTAEVLAMGELLSSSLGVATLKHYGVDAAWLDAREHLQSVALGQNDGNWASFLSANCMPAPSPALQADLRSSAACHITQGFIARNLKGQTVILGRGGSDTSAAYFGALLNARAVEIWTDVPGMFSANPRQVPDARLLQKLDYDEAQEIATTGAKVLHPRCLGPVREYQIPMWIKDTTRPELPGTCIMPRAQSASASVKAISVRTGLTLISMESLGMWQQVGFLADVFHAFKQHELSVDLIGSSETNVTISLDPSSNLLNAKTLEGLCQTLAGICRVKVLAPCAAITLVGHGIRSLMHRLSGVWEEVSDELVHLLTQSSNDLNLTFVVDEARAQELLPALHHALLEARVLPLDEPDVLGPSWLQLQASNARVVLEQPWWQGARDTLLQHANAGPQFVYSQAELQRRGGELIAMDAIDQWYYACKANAHPQVLRSLHELGFNIECVSWPEVEHVQDALKVPAQQLLFTPNFAPREEYQKAFAAGVQVTLDSVFALQEWPDLVRGQAIHLRLDLGFGGGHHAKVNTGGERSKFGLALNDLAQFKALAKALDVKVIGLHAHLGSGIRDSEHWPQVYAELANLSEQFPFVSVVNLGGGLGVPSHPDQARLDLSAINTRLKTLKELYPHLQIRMEPGRYPIAEAGVLLARITQIKSKGKGKYVGLDTGMNSLIRPALYQAYHHIVNLSRLDAELSWRNCTIVGPICETGDVLGEGRAFPESYEGDVVLIAEAGAYGAVMSSYYNRRAAAVEVML